MTNNLTKDISKKKQKYLGEKGFIVFIAFLGAFIPLSTDVYLNVYMLIICRILQSIGCGAATAVSTAIILVAWVTLYRKLYIKHT